MKKKILALLLLLPLLTGCQSKRTELKYEGKEGIIAFNIKNDSGCKLTNNKEDFRTTREQAMLVCSTFKIGIEFSDDFEYFYDGDITKLKIDKKTNKDYTEVKYSNIDGIQYFYSGYNRYNVILFLNGSEKYYLLLTVYGEYDNKESAKAAIRSIDLQDILNNISQFRLSNK